MTEAELWDCIVKKAEYIGTGAGHRSDVWELLGIILAFYQMRGTPPEQMIKAPEMKKAIGDLVKE